MLYTYKASQFNANTLEFTGAVEFYQAERQKDAAKKCLHTKRLTDGSAKIGPSRLVVYSRGFGWTITPAK